MIVTVHKKDKNTIVAVCDEAILGKTFEEGDKILDLTGDFYKGVSMSDSEAGDMIRNAHIVNLVGDQSVALGLREEIIENKNIKHIQGIPYAQAVIEI